MVSIHSIFLILLLGLPWSNSLNENNIAYLEIKGNSTFLRVDTVLCFLFLLIAVGLGKSTNSNTSYKFRSRSPSPIHSFLFYSFFLARHLIMFSRIVSKGFASGGLVSNRGSTTLDTCELPYTHDTIRIDQVSKIILVESEV